jgi:scyllo-inositol 2-dehydrogenase (NAD+)
MDDGVVFTIGAGWVLPPGYPNFSSTWIEMVGTEGAIMADDTHRDVALNTLKRGIELPISTMPGERLGHVYAGPMEAETIHFLDCVARGRQPLVTPEHARMVMQVYQAADESAEHGYPVNIVTSETAPGRPSPQKDVSIELGTAQRAKTVS